MMIIKLRVLNLAISNKSTLVCTNFSVFKREQIYVLAYSIQIHVYVIAYSNFSIFSFNAKFAKISTHN